ncbi:bifunctional phosphoribosyl-AMP cyclohydrolase/phosphoribosyl-ATP diphosphatase HisIE [Ornithinimicrobium murale]|uniref:bifunctional phosphoribosyl-AMP cyclohydrolase/phosphoribosyl-ATP diphosphatase HisIE n=1 Tax=Ornithinimicrobium murale TaxID=1050153 RepID=UPI000E0CF506|nr:bifunctional phosphoribosyl-AMP cyclohydrolase/phosphoribosyl-ATP diphosphatase HisIE [Ornithinimicrobium murale]
MSGSLQLPDGLGVADLDFAKQGGLLPAVVQHVSTGRVLMVGYQDAEALSATLVTGLATFYSRSRQEQWVKGATSGNYLRVAAVQVDCDRDTVLLLCAPDGATCHTGAESCFEAARAGSEVGPAGSDDRQGGFEVGPARSEARQGGSEVGSFLADLEQIVLRRDRERPEGSYTTSLLEGGIRRVAQKVGEEGVETALAAVVQEDPELVGESADLIYHLLVLLRSRGLGLADVETELRRRHG